MNKPKTTWVKLLFPPVWLIIILSVLCTVSLVAVLSEYSETPVAYAVYVISFYTLVVVCAFCVKHFPSYYRRTKNRIYCNPTAKKYFSDIIFRNNVNLYLSIAFNLIYAAFNLISAFIYNTAWFMIFSIYYAIMGLIRFLLVRYGKKDGIGELKRSRICSYLLLTVNLSLSAAVLMMIGFNRSFEYQGLLIYVMATYTFGTTAVAITEMVKYRKYNNPLISTAKMVKMASALMSMLFLETAMFSQFGNDTSPILRRVMIMATGAAISIVILSMAIYRIVFCTKEIKRRKIHGR